MADSALFCINQCQTIPAHIMHKKSTWHIARCFVFLVGLRGIEPRTS